MKHFETQAEIAKLARVLHLDAAELQALSSLDPQAVRGLRQAVQDRFFESRQPMFERLAAAARLLPLKLIAALGEKAFGPLLVARIAGELPPSQAVQVAARMRLPFLAEVCLHLDPRRAQGVLEAMPGAQVIQIALELVRRGEHIAMAEFVGVLSEPVLQALAEQLSADDLLEICLYAEDSARLSRLCALLPDGRLLALIAAAAAGAGPATPRWRSLYGRLDAGQRQRIARLRPEAVPA